MDATRTMACHAAFASAGPLPLRRPLLRAPAALPARRPRGRPVTACTGGRPVTACTGGRPVDASGGGRRAGVVRGLRRAGAALALAAGLALAPVGPAAARGGRGGGEAAAAPAVEVVTEEGGGAARVLKLAKGAAEKAGDVGKQFFGGEDDHGGGGHQAAVNDALVLLGTTVLIVPLMRRLDTSPILGFLAAGIALGPNGFALVRDVGTSKALAELGVVFFLFEMGLELSTSKLKSLGSDVFGLGTAQFLVTGALIGGVTMLAGLPSQTAIVVGAALALSSSAFVLQLLGERGEVGTRYGRAAFGVLLFQDLAVVPVLVLTPLLAKSGGASAVMHAVSIASAKAAVALTLIVFLGKTVLQPVFRFVAKAQSSEAFIATILFTALGTSALTSGLGLSDTLGAFLAGVMLAETTFRHQVEADIKPFRGLLLGLFFITVGFSIDLQLAIANIGTVASLVFGLLAIKAGVIAAAGVIFGLSTATALRTGLLLSQGGEFAFVIFGLAAQVGVLQSELLQLLLLVVALSMALTPTLADLGRRIAGKLERQRGLIGVRKEDADTADARDFVMVAGFGRVGQSVCEMLDSKLVRYVAFDMSPSRVIEARGKGLPVFFGDATRPEVLKAAGVQRARAVVVTLDDQTSALRAVQNIRREFGEDLEVFCRARDAKHQMLLKAAGATAIVPELLEASLLLGGAVLLAYGTPADEVSLLIQDHRRSNLGELGTNSKTLNEMLGTELLGIGPANGGGAGTAESKEAKTGSERAPSAPSASRKDREQEDDGRSEMGEKAARSKQSSNGLDLSDGSAGQSGADEAATLEAQTIETVALDEDIYATSSDQDIEDVPDLDGDAKGATRSVSKDLREGRNGPEASST